jgi:hypothetical protein
VHYTPSRFPYQVYPATSLIMHSIVLSEILVVLQACVVEVPWIQNALYYSWEAHTVSGHASAVRTVRLAHMIRVACKPPESGMIALVVGVWIKTHVPKGP